MSILTQGDIEFMKNTVRDIVDTWHTTITFIQPKPLSEQTNYDEYLHEFTGDAEYDYITVQAERKDIVNNLTNDLSPDDKEWGENDDGKYLYAIKDIIPVIKDGVQVGIKKFRPNNDAIVVIDESGDRYKITSMRDRIGEILVQITRYTGTIPKGSDILDDANIPVDGLKQEDEYEESEG